MKNSVFALALCGALAFALTGCKYDNAEGAGDLAAGAAIVDGNNDGVGAAGATDVATATDPNAEAEAARLAAEAEAARRAAEAAALKNADSVSLDAATGVPFDQDPNFTRATDVDFAPVYFGFDADALVSSELAKIEAVAKHLMQKANRVVIIEGNCDERGSNEYNLALGEQRAIKIKEYILKLGIAENRVQTKSYGEEKPAVTGANEAAWSKNRRGEFAIFQHK